MTEAPIRDVVRVEERVGPRGGRTLVLHLSCGCFLTRSSKAPPPKRARCIPCSVGALSLETVIEAAIDAAFGELARLVGVGTIDERVFVEARNRAMRTTAAHVAARIAARGASARSNSRPNDA